MTPFLPANVASLAVAAPGLPEGSMGWTAESVRRAIDVLHGGKIALVGIDVYDRVVWGFAPADETWICYRLSGEPALAFAARSRAEARSWISRFPRENVLFVLEFSGQDDAAQRRA
jgi:hypothetical protein